MKTVILNESAKAASPLKQLLWAIAGLGCVSLISHSVLAADIFVRPVEGASSDQAQAADITSLVRNAIRAMPEQNLVTQESSADFVIQPRVLNQGAQPMLRLERYKDGTLISSSQQALDTVENDRQGAYGLTQQALKNDSYVSSSGNNSANGAMNAPGPGPAIAQRSYPIGDQSSSSDGYQAQNLPSQKDRMNMPLKTEPGATAQAYQQPNRNRATQQGTSAPTDVTPVSDTSGSTSQGTQDTENQASSDTPNQTTTIPPQDQNQNTGSYGSANVSNERSPAVNDSSATGRGMMGVSESRTISPRHSLLGGPGYFTAGTGAGFSSGLHADSTLFDVNGGYNIDVNTQFTAKAFVDMNLGAGTDVSRFVDLAVGGNYYPPTLQFVNSRPYLTGDLGLGFARNELNDSENGLAAGVGAGFQFEAQSMNFDINAHYTLLTAQIQQSNPQIVGIRLAVNF